MLHTESFERILLEEMDQVKLMNRTDTKYWFRLSDLQAILDVVKNDYFILSIDGKTLMPYSTTYFDTDKNEMFAKHHNGKLNRYKIRKRSYVNSGISFLEIKFKSNKGRTIKKRIPAESKNGQLSAGEDKFIQSVAPYAADKLQPSLLNQFERITLVNRNFKERCTIDLNLQFKGTDKEIELENLVIVEIKSEGHSNMSSLALALRDHRIKASGFSKYCVGRTVTDHQLKRNAFKKKIRSIEKLIQPKTELYHIN